LNEGPRGRFITIEGGDGAGKTTQARLLAARLEREGIAVCLTREPGGSAGAEAVRRMLLAGETTHWDAIGEALLLVAARRDHVTSLILPSLAQGIWIVCDRFADSTLAYQGYGRGVDLEQLAMLHRFAVDDLAPDLTVILDVSVDIAASRAASRATPKDRFERLDRAFRERLRQGFCRIAERDPGRCVLIDAAGNPDRIHQAVFAVVADRLPLPSREQAQRRG
jgi:dTMP kinase